jgi:hypothetical protein
MQYNTFRTLFVAMMSYCYKSISTKSLYAVHRVPTVAWRPPERNGEKRDVRTNIISVYDGVSHMGISSTNMTENVHLLFFLIFRFRWKFRENFVYCQPFTSISFGDVRSLFFYNLSIFVLSSSVFFCFAFFSFFFACGFSVPASFHRQT